MTPIDLLAALRAAGFAISIRAGKLIVGPKERITAEWRRTILEHRDGLLALLAEAANAPDPFPLPGAGRSVPDTGSGVQSGVRGMGGVERQPAGRIGEQDGAAASAGYVGWFRAAHKGGKWSICCAAEDFRACWLAVIAFKPPHLPHLYKCVLARGTKP